MTSRPVGRARGRATGREVAVVAHAERPIPLTFEWSEVPLQEKVEEFVSTHQAPVYIVHFSQLDAVETAQGLSSISVTSREEKEAIAARIAYEWPASGT